MPDIFDEVSEDLRAERARTLAVRYGGLGVLLLLLILVATGAYEFWNWRHQQAQGRMAGLYLAALDAADRPTDTVAARGLLDRAQATGGASYRVLAMLRLASLQAANGDTAGAIAMWDRVAADSAAPRMLAELATLYAVDRQLDTGNPAALQARLAPLAAPGGAWRGQALEAQALLDVRQGRIDDARETLRGLAQDSGASQGTKARVAGELQALGEGARGIGG